MNKLTAEWCKYLLDDLKRQSITGCGIGTVQEGYLQALEIALPVLEHQGGWISCSERMPEVYVAVNFWAEASDEHDVCEGTYNGYWDGEVWHQDATLTGYDNSPMVRSYIQITHWQPLPAPPQPSTTPQIDNDGWIHWGGGECPVIPGNRVDLKLRGGVITKDFPAECAEWSHRNEGYTDIIAYRVIENDGREG